jgi:hypothetical protein
LLIITNVKKYILTCCRSFITHPEIKEGERGRGRESERARFGRTKKEQKEYYYS